MNKHFRIQRPLQLHLAVHPGCAFGNLLVGFVLFFGAEYIVALAYPTNDEADEVRRF